MTQDRAWHNLLVQALHMDPELARFEPLFLFSKTLSITKCSEMSLKQDYFFVCEKSQSKDSSYFQMEA